ncbi:MAG: c-type cytochrome, partial [Solirubrobacterales bacterium]|nr:c-type cytochrome [Solirubrobacterales bacterium]
QAAAAGDATAGKTVFLSSGCGSCHTLADAGPGAVGQIGPNLDVELANQDEGFIMTSIIDPSAEVEQGFGDGIMPQDYETQLSSKELADLVAYLSASAGSK